MNEQTRQLYDDGFCLFRNVFDLELIAKLHAATDRLLDAESAEEKERKRYQGSSISLRYQDPVLGELIGWPGSLDALAHLGFTDAKYWTGYILSKAPGGPPLYWHQDWIFWDDPISAEPDPGQLFLMIYLVDTSVFNGCLRVIPGTHRRRIALHDHIFAAHGEEAQKSDETSEMFAVLPDEMNVEVNAGDLVIGDSRVLHAAHGNQSDQRRTCITLWYHPFFERFPDSIKKNLVACVDHVDVPEDTAPPELAERLRRLKPHFAGSAEERDWVRVPTEHLSVG
jgi:hypothetical protein